jgi:putative FmdB family regulatory protein
MPTYEYECPKCGSYDVEQRITAPALTACEKCGGPVRKLISRSSFALKGGGWYADGYAGKSSGGGSGGSGGGASGSLKKAG